MYSFWRTIWLLQFTQMIVYAQTTQIFVFLLFIFLWNKERGKVIFFRSFSKIKEFFYVPSLTKKETFSPEVSLSGLNFVEILPVESSKRNAPGKSFIINFSSSKPFNFSIIKQSKMNIWHSLRFIEKRLSFFSLQGTPFRLHKTIVIIDKISTNSCSYERIQ